MTATLSKEQKREREGLFGDFSEGLRPIKPYRWQVDGGGLIEIPVTTMPLIRIPIHVSYLIYLGMFSPTLARLYFQSAMNLCSLTGTQLSLLLHPLDFLGCDDERDLSFFPAMGIPSERKLQFVSDAIDSLACQFTIVTMQQHARELALNPNIKLLEPKFHHPDSATGPSLPHSSSRGRVVNPSK